jgi:hypothetical protein
VKAAAKPAETTQVEPVLTTGSSQVEVFADYLKGEGYLPKIDEEGDIRFKVEGKSFCIAIMDDPTFISLRHFGIWSIESQEERDALPLAALEAGKRTKAAKVFVSDIETEEAFVATYTESFLSQPNDIGGVFDRLLSANQSAQRNFIEAMNNLMEME